MSRDNTRRRLLAIAGLTAGIFAATDVTCAQIPCAYDVTLIMSDLDCGHSDSGTIPQGMNEQGAVVGYHKCAPAVSELPFLWTPESGFTNIGLPPGFTSAQAVDVNDGLQITGTMGCVSTSCRAFLYDGTKFVDLGVLPGDTWSSGSALNGAAQVVGSSDWKAFLWEDGVMTGLQLPLGPLSSAKDVNESSKIVGQMGSGGSDWHGFLWDGAKVVDLGVVPGGSTSQAVAINNLLEPQVVGWGQLPEATHAFLWESGEMTDLGTLPGFLRSFAFDINDSSTVVGFCRTPDRAFVWHKGVMKNLNELIPPELGITLSRAGAIDNAGRIAVTGGGPDGTVGYLLTPIEPSLGDLDGDCSVGLADLLTLLSNWGPCDECDVCLADLDDDCSVGVSDLVTLLGNWD